MDLDASLTEQSCSYVRKNSHGSSALLWAIFALLAVTTWARGGSNDITPWLQFALASIVVVVFIWEVLSGDFKGFAGGIFRDPILYLGVGILALLGVQWFNSGRELFYDSALKTWLYSDAPYANFLFAFNASEAQEVWIWFYCALVTVVAVRSSLMSRRGIYRLWRLLILNSCLLGLFGMVQFLSGTDKIFWIKQLPYQRFFASFGYSNHAGAYFILMLFLTLSMLVRRIFRHTPHRFSMRAFLLLSAVLLQLLCANFTLSRFAILVSWLGVVMTAVYISNRLWRRGAPAMKMNLAVLLTASGIVAIYASFSAAGAMLGKELASFLHLNEDFLSGYRWIIFHTGISVWRESPLFGVGPWGFRHLAALHLDQGLHFMLKQGAANLHNDALQYLAESGLVGFSLMIGVLGVLLSRFRLAVLRHWMPGAILCAGLSAIALQSTFDLPFRNPAILYCWLAILAGASKISWEKCRENKALSGNGASSASACVNERDS